MHVDPIVELLQEDVIALRANLAAEKAKRQNTYIITKRLANCVLTAFTGGEVSAKEAGQALAAFSLLEDPTPKSDD